MTVDKIFPSYSLATAITPPTCRFILLPPRRWPPSSTSNFSRAFYAVSRMPSGSKAARHRCLPCYLSPALVGMRHLAPAWAEQGERNGANLQTAVLGEISPTSQRQEMTDSRATSTAVTCSFVSTGYKVLEGFKERASPLDCPWNYSSGSARDLGSSVTTRSGSTSTTSNNRFPRRSASRTPHTDYGFSFSLLFLP